MAITREEATKRGLEELYDEVKCLERLTDQQEIIKKLQDIEAELLSKYEAQIGELLIEPIWIEAYYNRKGIFEDDNCHKKPDQWDHFGEMYFNEVGRGGFDVCLSNGPYYLSFLFKAYLVGGEYNKQTGIYEFFPKKDDQTEAKEKFKLCRKETSSRNQFVFANRVNLKGGSFEEAPLGVFSLDDIRNYDFSFPTGYQQQWRHAFYALLHSNDSEEAREIAKKSNKSAIDSSAWSIALESWKDYKNSNSQSILFKNHP